MGYSIKFQVDCHRVQYYIYKEYVVFEVPMPTKGESGDWVNTASNENSPTAA